MEVETRSGVCPLCKAPARVEQGFAQNEESGTRIPQRPKYECHTQGCDNSVERP